MTVERIDPTTGEVASLTEGEARRLTERIRIVLDRVSTAWADLAERITEAYQRRADLALGYGSWAEYAEAELRPSEGIAADVRRQLVGMLSAQGMSTRAIAPTVGVSIGTVHSDRASGVQRLNTSPATRTDEMREVLAAAEREARIVKLTGPESVTTPGKITGLDGKTYTRPEPRTPARRPITDAFWEAAYDLARKVETLQRLTEDDRFSANRAAIAGKNLAAMKETANTLAGVLTATETQLNSQKA